MKTDFEKRDDERRRLHDQPARVSEPPRRDLAARPATHRRAVDNLPSLARAFVSDSYAMTAIRVAQESGADLRKLGAACGLGDLTQPIPANIPVEKYMLLLHTAAELVGDPYFGLHVGQSVRGVFARGYGLVLLACKDIRSVIAQSLRFESLDHDFGRTELVEDGGVAHLRIHSPWLDLPGGRHLIDCAASGIRAQANWIAGQLLPAFGFATTFEAPAGVAMDEYTRVLGAPVRFGAAFNEVSFPAILLDLPLPTSDAAALPTLERAAAKRLEARQHVSAPPIVNAVCDQIRATINRGAPRLSEIAATLGLAERTLQRKLAQSNATFAKLLDDVRREIAADLLQEDDVSLVDVAFQLGYSEQSAFNHAFRDWFGTSPSQWRKARA